MVLPDVNDFSVSISSLGEQVCGWSSYKDMSEEEMPELRVGTYRQKLGTEMCQRKDLNYLILKEIRSLL